MLGYRYFAEIAKSAPSRRSGHKVTVATLRRWVTLGVRGPGPDRIKLNAKRGPGGWLTRDTDIEEFLHAITAAHLPAAAGSPPAA